MKRLLNIHRSIGPSEIKMVSAVDGAVLNTNIHKAKLAISTPGICGHKKKISSISADFDF